MKKYRVTSSTWPIFRKIAWGQAIFIIIGILISAMLYRYAAQKSFSSISEDFLKENLKTIKRTLEKLDLSPAFYCGLYSDNQTINFNAYDFKTLTKICPTGNDQRNFVEEEFELLKKTGHVEIVRESEGGATLHVAFQVKSQGQDWMIRLKYPLQVLSSALDGTDRNLYLILLPLVIVLSFFSLFYVLFYEGQEEKRISQLKGDLISNISHEVRTPLTAMKGYVQILQTIKDFPEEQKGLLRKIEANSERLNQLFSDILSLTQIEKKMNPSLELIDLPSFFDHIIEAVKMGKKNKEIKLEVKVPKIQFTTDSLLLSNILNNLVDNAFKYTPDGGEVIVSADFKDRKLLIIVQDSGMGIPEKHLESIFQRFYRVDVSRSRELGGTGLGLAIVKHSVNKLQGSVWVESEKKKGSKFTVELPDLSD